MLKEIVDVANELLENRDLIVYEKQCDKPACRQAGSVGE